MAAKKSYIEIELDFAEQQLASWKEYIDKHPINSLTDRMDYKETARGGMVKTVIASIEQQGKYIQELLKNYLSLLKEVDTMRAQEAEKVEKRGKGELNKQQEQLLGRIDRQ